MFCLAGKDFVFESATQPHPAQGIMCYNIDIIDNNDIEHQPQDFFFSVSTRTSGVILPPGKVQILIVDDDNDTESKDLLKNTVGAAVGVLLALLLTLAIAGVGLCVLAMRRSKMHR